MQTNPPYYPASVANYFLSKSKIISPLKLQKLIYYAHGWHLAYKENPLINEPIEAWPFGPVVSSIYHEFKDFGSRNINRLASVYDPGCNSLVQPSISSGDEFAIKLLDEVLSAYGKIHAIQLSNSTHLSGTPWHKTWTSNGSISVIGDDIIKTYFQAKLSNKAI